MALEIRNNRHWAGVQPPYSAYTPPLLKFSSQIIITFRHPILLCVIHLVKEDPVNSSWSVWLLLSRCFISNCHCGQICSRGIKGIPYSRTLAMGSNFYNWPASTKTKEWVLIEKLTSSFTVLKFWRLLGLCTRLGPLVHAVSICFGNVFIIKHEHHKIQHKR